MCVRACVCDYMCIPIYGAKFGSVGGGAGMGGSMILLIVLCVCVYVCVCTYINAHARTYIT